MPSTAHLAKISCPSAEGLLERSLLFALLDRLRSGRCIWICAPAGAGKTSLVSGWIAAASIACGWYSVDAGDADPAGFFHYLGLLAQSVAHGSRKKNGLPHLTPDRMPALDVFVKRFFEAFFLRSGTPFVLVLDNVQDVAHESPFYAILGGLLDTMPQGALLVCLSREEPAPPLARWAAQRDFHSLGWDDLRLDDAEASEMARLLGADRRTDVRTLNRRVEGWAAGLALMVRARAARIEVDAVGQQVPKVLFDYIATEVFDRTSPNMRDFLLRTAILPRVTPEIARELTGHEEAGEWLRWLHRKRLFTSRRPDSTAAVYEYHPLFRDFLLERARHEIGRDDRVQLARRSAELLERTGELESAANLWCEASEWAQMERLACMHAPALLAQGRIATLEAWIEAMPLDRREASPWLLYWLGTCHVFRDAVLGRKSLELAYVRFGQQGDLIGAFLAVGGILSSYFHQWGGGLDPWITELEALLAANDGAIPAPAEVQVLASCVAILFRRPDHPLLPRLLQRAEELLVTIRDPVARVMLAGFVISNCIWAGHYAKARPLCDDLWRCMQNSTATWPRIFCATLCGCVAWQQADHAAARTILAEALALGQDTGVRMLEPMVYLHLAYTYLSAGDLDAAEEALDAGSAGLAADREVELLHYRFLRAGVLLYRGRLQDAVALATVDQRSALECLSPFGQATFRIQIAQMLALCGRHGEAREHLEWVLDYAERAKSDILQFQGRLALAWSLLETGHDAAAVQTLAPALAIGRRQDYMNCHPWWLPEVMSRLCARALESRVEVDYVRRLIRKRDLAPPEGQPEQPDWPYRVRIFTLGRFSVMIDGEPLRFSSKAQKKPLELLKAVIAMGGRGVAIDALVEQLWPDLEGPAAHNAFNVALHRLRRLLGDDDAVTVQGSSVFVSPRLAWVDAWAFERVAGLAAELSAPVSARPLAARLQQLYGGHFLAEEALPCAVLRRERLRSKFVRASSALGSLLEDTQCFIDAADVYQRAVEIDPLAEDFHRGVMRCLRAQGRVPEAIEAYRRCRHLLSVALGVQPSAETQALYRTLGH